MSRQDALNVTLTRKKAAAEEQIPPAIDTDKYFMRDYSWHHQMMAQPTKKQATGLAYRLVKELRTYRDIFTHIHRSVVWEYVPGDASTVDDLIDDSQHANLVRSRVAEYMIASWEKHMERRITEEAINVARREFQDKMKRAGMPMTEPQAQKRIRNHFLGWATYLGGEW